MDAPNPSQTFLVEAADLLDQVEEIVLEVEKHPGDAEAVNRLFRAFHTIKGSGAMFGFEAVAQFTHHVETTLDRLRRGEIAVSAELVALILAARDHLQQLLAPGADAVALATVGEGLAAQLHVLAGERAEGGRAPAKDAAVGSGAAEDPGNGSAGAVERADGPLQRFRIYFKPGPDVAASGLDPAALIAELRTLGACDVKVDAAGVPPLAQLEPTRCHLAWNVVLTTRAGLNPIKDVFAFVEDTSTLRITPEPSTAAPVRARAPAVVPVAARRAEAAGVAEGGGVAKALRDGVVRVPSQKLDHLVSLVGELVMNESRLSQVAARLADPELGAPVESIERLIAELRDAVLGIRMMPIGTTFSRFKRLVHDLSRDLGKEVDLVTEGAETELDKTVLDQLADPLVHLIRNSIDHGIGSPAEREAAGKSRRGTVRLAASHQGSHVVVTVEDDGAGLNAAAIRAKAIEKQLIAPDASLSEAEIFNLVFLPGFSTAKQVTAISGRGVGMDVVRRQVEALRGTIQLSSRPGRGTTLSLSLPLTLAIIEGLLVSIGGDPYIVPMGMVTETVELQRAERMRHNGRNLIDVRGELVPYLHLRELFGVSGATPDIEKIVITRLGQGRVGLVVDRVLGSHQTVIQSLGRVLKDIGVVSGCTILGDGRVALILDVSGVVGYAEREAKGDRSASAIPAMTAA